MHHLVAAYLGYKAPVQTSAQPPKPVQDFEDVMAALGEMPVRLVTPIDTTAFDAAFPSQKNV